MTATSRARHDGALPSSLGASAVAIGRVGRALAAIALALGLAACTAGAEVTAPAVGVGSACEQAFAAAAARPQPPTGTPDLDDAIRRCRSLEDWRRSAELHPAALAGLDPDIVLRDRCADASAGLAGYQVCGLLGIAVAPPRPTHRPAATPRPTPEPTKRPRETPWPTARRQSRSTQRPKVPVIKPAFFGPNVRVSWYTITGDTATELIDSISERGPYHAWLGESAIAVTRSLTQRRFSLVGSGSSCKIVSIATPAIRTTFSIVLPRWKPTRTADEWTIRWWADELRAVARHEREHVRISRAATRRANKVLASSDCSDWAARLDGVFRKARRDNCRFDMDEYGTESGLTLRACIGG